MITGITKEKRECERLGNEYKTVLNVVTSFFEANLLAKDVLNNNFVIEKLQELCIGLETGELEIIKFGQILGDKE